MGSDLLMATCANCGRAFSTYSKLHFYCWRCDPAQHAPLQSIQESKDGDGPHTPPISVRLPDGERAYKAVIANSARQQPTGLTPEMLSEEDREHLKELVKLAKMSHSLKAAWQGETPGPCASVEWAERRGGACG